MKMTLAIVATVLFMILLGCGEPDYIQVNESEIADPATPTQPDRQFPEPDAGQTEKDASAPSSSCPIILYYRDKDGDGYGRLSMATFANCSDQYFPGWTTEAGDCNDRNPYVYPGAPEICNNRDDDCDMIVDDKCTTDCAYKADGTPAKNQGAADCAQTTDFGVCSGNWICLNGQLTCSAVDESCPNTNEDPRFFVWRDYGSPSGAAVASVQGFALAVNMMVYRGNSVAIDGLVFKVNQTCPATANQKAWLVSADNQTEPLGEQTRTDENTFVFNTPLKITQVLKTLHLRLDTSKCRQGDTLQVDMIAIYSNVIGTGSSPIEGNELYY